MSRERWRSIKQYKLFYINTYHTLANVLLVIFGLNLMVSLGIVYVYFHQSERQYYATDGIKPPQELVEMDSPNMTPNPLLPDDPVNEDLAKSMPE